MLNSAVDIAHTIQLAVAPVFLLAGIAGFLNVMSVRLGRIIDRSRTVRQRLIRLADNPEETVYAERELAMLVRRSVIINVAIGLCTGSAALVCLLIVCLFAAGALSLSLGGLIAGFFVVAMLLLIGALLSFLKEVQLATRSLKITREVVLLDR